MERLSVILQRLVQYYSRMNIIIQTTTFESKSETNLFRMKEFDAIIIGTGQAGPSIAARCAAEGLNTAIIERARFGGTCVNNGCTPTKALVASARSAFMARRSADFGVNISGKVSVDMKAVKARKDKIVEQSTTGVENWLKNTKNLTVFEGHAQFESNKSVRVGDDILIADKIFVMSEVERTLQRVLQE